MPKYSYDFEIPKDYEHDVELDKSNRNTRWQDCTDLELEQSNEYSCFIDLGKFINESDEYKKIHTHLIYAMKHDATYKARMVSDSHPTDVPLDSVYSGVVSLLGLRLVLFLAY